MSNVIVNDSTRITVTFRNWNSTTSTGSVVDPTTVAGAILDEDAVVLSSFTPTRSSTGVYYYVWTPTTVGTYTIRFTGTYSDGSTDVVQEDFIVYETSTSATTVTQTLGEDQYLWLMTELSPIYIDPEEISAIFPDASLVEINEYLFIASAEVDELLDGADMTTLAYDYVKAATLCALSKIYDLADSDLSSFTLGDLSVTTRAFPKSRVTRANSSSWCELAAALREEIIKKWRRSGMKAIVKGDAYPNPIPPRPLERKEST